MTRATLAEVDARIADLRATVERITANLAGLDGDLTRQMLDASTSLRGRTEEAWTAARGGLERLWQGQLALHEVVERSRPPGVSAPRCRGPRSRRSPTCSTGRPSPW